MLTGQGNRTARLPSKVLLYVQVGIVGGLERSPMVVDFLIILAYREG
jgi:hypothetical protein